LVNPVNDGFLAFRVANSPSHVLSTRRERAGGEIRPLHCARWFVRLALDFPLMALPLQLCAKIEQP
jgi:hypothetical protein